MKYKTPKIGEIVKLIKRSSGRGVHGEVEASVECVGFRVCGRVFLDSDRGDDWILIPKRIVLENK